MTIEIVLPQHRDKEIHSSLLLRSLDQIIPKEIDPNNIYMINIAGASASGKSTIALDLSRQIPGSDILNLDDYLLGWSIGPLDHDSGDPTKPYFAGLNPGVYDLGRLYVDLLTLKKGRSIQRPIFDEVNKTPVGTSPFSANSVLIYEGIYALESPFLELGDMHVLIEADLHDRLVRKIVRNNLTYEQEVNDIILTYLTKDEPTYPYYRNNLRSKAQLIVNNPLEPNRDFENFTVRKNTIPDSTCQRITPKQGNGSMKPEEKLTIAKLNRNQHLLSYVIKDKTLVHDVIDNEVLSLLLSYYDIIV
jgi:uridine kinase